MKKHKIRKKIADFVRGTPEPNASLTTWSEWNAWGEAVKKKHPVRCWLADQLPILIKSVIASPITLADKFQTYCINRYTSKMHCLTATPKHLPRGKYFSFEHRLVYCVFDEFVRFVNSDLASCSEYKHRWVHKIPYFGHFFEKSNPEAGLAALEELASEKFNFYQVSNNSPLSGTPTPGSQIWKDILEVYVWYTTVFPEYQDPDDVSGYNAHLDIYGFDWQKTFPKEIAEEQARLRAISNQIKNEREQLITKYLTTLIKHRQYLWS